MKQNPIEEGRFSEHGHGLGTVTRGMIRQRAKELALIEEGVEDAEQDQMVRATRESLKRETKR